LLAGLGACQAQEAAIVMIGTACGPANDSAGPTDSGICAESQECVYRQRGDMKGWECNHSCATDADCQDACQSTCEADGYCKVVTFIDSPKSC
jgi:hypothetical protein